MMLSLGLVLLVRRLGFVPRATALLTDLSPSDDARAGDVEAGLLRSKSTVSMLMQCRAGLCVLSIQVNVMRSARRRESAAVAATMLSFVTG